MVGTIRVPRCEAMTNLLAWEVAEASILGLLEGDFASLSIELNEHAASYLTARQAVMEGESGYYPHVTWLSDEDRERAMEANRVWVVQCYPRTPISFWAVAGSNLAAVMAEVHRLVKEGL